MKRQIDERNIHISTILTFILIPFSGLATDAYLPSFPEMAQVFQTSSTSIQQTLVFFLVSYGIGQIFSGSILDSLGRYRLTLIALFLFAVSNFVIIFTRSIEVVYLMRVLQGFCTAFIMVSKRAFFIDVYTGEKQKHYTSLVTIVWSTAPIIAPFLGGYLQTHFGWKANFYLLGIYTIIMCILELLFSGESLKITQPFRLQAMVQSYKKLINTSDFVLGILILGALYSMVMVFNMSIPFVVEKQFHLPPVITGYCALFSGVALLAGNFLGKMLKNGSLFGQLLIGNLIHYGLIVLMLVCGFFLSNLIILMIFVVLIHLIGGAIFNRFFTYCIMRFPKNAGLASGIIGGGMFIFASLFTPGVLNLITVTGQNSLAICYLIFALMISGVVISLRYYSARQLMRA